VTWPLDGGEAGVDLVLIQTSLLLLCKTSCSDVNKVHLHDKSSEVFIKTRSTPASLSSKGQVTEQTTVKWSILWFCKLMIFSNVIIDIIIMAHACSFSLVLRFLTVSSLKEARLSCKPPCLSLGSSLSLTLSSNSWNLNDGLWATRVWSSCRIRRGMDNGLRTARDVRRDIHCSNDVWILFRFVSGR